MSHAFTGYFVSFLLSFLVWSSSFIFFVYNNGGSESSRFRSSPRWIKCKAKKTLNISNWKVNVAKQRKNSGLPYLGQNGMLRPGKSGPSAGKVCSRKCRFLGCAVPHEEKLRIFREYLKMESWSTKRTYLAALLHRHQEGRRIKYTYFLRANGGQVQCCRESFMDVHQIKRGSIVELQKKIANGVICITDGRGKHHNRPRRVPDDVKESMLNHVMEFPTYESHYTRNLQGQHHYLSPDLNLKRMFNLYCQQHRDTPDVYAKLSLYKNVFRSTNRKIGQPKKDTCKTCDLLNVKFKNSQRAEERAAFKTDADIHHFTWNEARKAMNEDILRSAREPQRYVVKCVDMQQILFCPTLTHGEMFFLRQYASYNYCVYDGATAISNMYFWEETDAKRGVDEVGSIILKCIRDEYQPLEVGEERTLILWSDRCRGQTNNFFMIMVLVKLLQLGYFTTVEQKFLVTGHSFLPCDSSFGSIERRKKDSAVYVPAQWMDVIRTAQPDKPFRVIRLQQIDINDMKTAFQSIPKPTTLKTSEIARLLISKNAPHRLLVRPDHFTGVWNSHDVHAPNQARMRLANRRFLSLIDVEAFIIARKYNAPIPLSEEKKKDLRKMLDYLVDEHKAYYRPFLLAQAGDNENEDDLLEAEDRE